LTAAQVNAASRAGTNIVSPVAGKTITVVDCMMRAIGGNAGGATAVVLEDTTGTDVVSNTVGILTQNAIVRAGITNSTATNLGTSLGKGAGLRIGCTVGDLTTASHIDYVVLYKIDSD
jgi:hypothetical protein